MGKLVNSLIGVFFAAILLAGCGGNAPIESDSTQEAKKPDEQVEKEFDEDGEIADEAKDDASDAEKEDDLWTYFEDATWEGDFNGLVTTIEKVVVAEDAPHLDDNGKETEKPAVGIKVILDNTSDQIIETSIDFATLVTSTGEQVEADMVMSDFIGGEIHEGVVKEGDIIFYLDRGEVDDIAWIKLEWDELDPVEFDEGNVDEAMHKASVELELAK